MIAPARARISEQEFLALPETAQPMELVDGEVVMSPSPSFWHQEVLTRLVGELRAWARTQQPAPTVAQSPLDIRLAPDRILQPDAMVFLEPLERTQAQPITRVPDLCVEVLSTNRSYDRITKRYIYAEAQVQEYWIIDPAGFIERRRGSGLVKLSEHETTLDSELLPGFRLDVAQLLSS